MRIVEFTVAPVWDTVCRMTPRRQREEQRRDRSRYRYIDISLQRANAGTADSTRALLRGNT